MGMEMPFGDEVMTIIMGIDPSEPGMHGPMERPCPTDDAVELVCKIRDMCDEWLRSAGKCDEQRETPDTSSQKFGDTGEEDQETE